MKLIILEENLKIFMGLDNRVNDINQFVREYIRIMRSLT